MASSDFSRTSPLVRVPVLPNDLFGMSHRANVVTHYENRYFFFLGKYRGKLTAKAIARINVSRKNGNNGDTFQVPLLISFGSINITSL